MIRLQMATFAIIIALGTTAQDLQPWKIRFPQNGALHTTITGNNQVIQQAMGSNMETTQKTSLKEKINCSAQSGKVLLEKSTIELDMEMNMMGQTLKFNSSDSADLNGPIGNELKPLLTRVVKATIDNEGKIEVLTPPVTNANLAAMMNFTGNDNADSAGIASLFLLPPSATLPPGGTWQEKVEGNGLQQVTTYTYRLTKDGVAYIDFVMTTEVDKTTQVNGMDIQSQTQTTAKGTLQVELSTGIVLYREINSETKGKNIAMGMELPLEGKGQMIVTVQR